MSVEALPKQTDDQDQKSESSERANGDRLRVTGSGALYVEDVDDFLASKRVQKTISSVNRSVNRSIEVAETGDRGEPERERKLG